MRARFLLLAAALAAFGASLGSGFHFDDYAIFSDPVLTSPWGWLQVWGWRQTRPLTYLTFWLNYQAGGQDAAGIPRPQPAAAFGRGAAGLRVPAPPSARARGAGGGRVVRGTPAASRSRGLRLGPQHRAGGAAVLCRAAVLDYGPAVDGRGLLRGGAAGEGGVRGLPAGAGHAAGRGREAGATSPSCSACPSPPGRAWCTPPARYLGRWRAFAPGYRRGNTCWRKGR